MPEGTICVVFSKTPRGLCPLGTPARGNDFPLTPHSRLWRGGTHEPGLPRWQSGFMIGEERRCGEEQKVGETKGGILQIGIIVKFVVWAGFLG